MQPMIYHYEISTYDDTFYGMYIIRRDSQSVVFWGCDPNNYLGNGVVAIPANQILDIEEVNHTIYA